MYTTRNCRRPMAMVSCHLGGGLYMGPRLRSCNFRYYWRIHGYLTGGGLGERLGPNVGRRAAFAMAILSSSCLAWYTLRGDGYEEQEDKISLDCITEKDVVQHEFVPGSVYLLGSNGRASGSSSCSPVPYRLPLDSEVKVSSMAMDDDECLLIDQKGDLCSWSKKEEEFHPLMRGRLLEKVVCGDNGMAAALSRDGSELWYRSDRKSGLEKVDLKMLPSAVVKLVAGSGHLVFLTCGGEVYTLGSNSSGQCGRKLSLEPSEQAKWEHLPYLVPLPNPVTDIAAGASHTVVITNDNNVWSFGDNKYCQLGLEQIWRDYDYPQLPYVPFGSYAEIRYNEQGRKKIWSDWRTMDRSKDDRLFYAHPDPVRIPYFVQKGIDAEGVYCGDYSTLVLAKDKNLYGFGAGNYGQLSRASLKSFNMPAHLRHAPTFGLEGKVEDSNPVQIECGSRHCMALTPSNQLFSWGWNQTGACGTGDCSVHSLATRILKENGKPILSIWCAKNSSAIML